MTEYRKSGSSSLLANQFCHPSNFKLRPSHFTGCCLRKNIRLDQHSVPMVVWTSSLGPELTKPTDPLRQMSPMPHTLSGPKSQKQAKFSGLKRSDMLDVCILAPIHVIHLSSSTKVRFQRTFPSVRARTTLGIVLALKASAFYSFGHPLSACSVLIPFLSVLTDHTLLLPFTTTSSNVSHIMDRRADVLVIGYGPGQCSSSDTINVRSHNRLHSRDPQVLHSGEQRSSPGHGTCTHQRRSLLSRRSDRIR